MITAGKLPPSPEHIVPLLKEMFVDTGMCPIEQVYALREVYTLHKKISHGEVQDVPGADIDKWQNAARKFIGEMTRIIDILVEKSKKEK